jgi:hypothetical protein
LTRDSTTGTAGAPDASTQGVTLSIPTHMAAPSHALVLREGPKPTRPRGRIPRVARLLALAPNAPKVLKRCIADFRCRPEGMARVVGRGQRVRGENGAE